MCWYAKEELVIQFENCRMKKGKEGNQLRTGVHYGTMMPQCKLPVICNICEQSGHISPVYSQAAGARNTDTAPDQLATSNSPDLSAAAFYAPAGLHAQFAS